MKYPPKSNFNVYNRNTWRWVNLVDELQHAERWIVAGDMNAHYPRWSRANREPSEDWRHVLPIVNAGTLSIEPGTITRIGSAGQRSSTIDLVISGPEQGIDSLSAIVAEDVRTGSDHEVITWKLFADDQGLPNNSIAYDDQTPAWKLRAPIKTDDKDELKEWREKWISGFSPYTEPMTEISRFTKFLGEEFGRKRWSPFAKRWWSDELDKERQRLFCIPRNSVGYKAARAQWFKTVRKAKRECWEEFLQLSDTDAVWKTINPKPARHPMPTLGIQETIIQLSWHQPIKRKLPRYQRYLFQIQTMTQYHQFQDTGREYHIFSLYAPRVSMNSYHQRAIPRPRGRMELVIKRFAYGRK
jgi:hypothetical protein